jgi:hypothetical protein
MNRRAFVAGLAAMLAAPLGAEAQQAGKVRIGSALALNQGRNLQKLRSAE